MTASDLSEFLASQGCTIQNLKSGSGHLTVRRGTLTAQIPVHKEGEKLGAALVERILKQLQVKP